MTLSLFGQWANLPSERAFYRYAQRHLCSAFPTLPARSQFNRLQRRSADVITAFGLFIVSQSYAQQCLYERLDFSGIATRDSKRRGDGWLAGQADIGWSNRVGWYEGLHLLVSIAQKGMITGYGFGSASIHDRQTMESFLQARASSTQSLSSVGLPAQRSYIADKCFAGEKPASSLEAANGCGRDYAAASEQQTALAQRIATMVGTSASAD